MLQVIYDWEYKIKQARVANEIWSAQMARESESEAEARPDMITPLVEFRPDVLTAQEYFWRKARMREERKAVWRTLGICALAAFGILAAYVFIYLGVREAFCYGAGTWC